jgi:hypothetical protein
MVESIVERLLKSDEPSIRLKTRTEILCESSSSRAVKELLGEVKRSRRVKLLLSGCNDTVLPLHPYSKWNGSHWVLSLLADLGYPSGDTSLLPLREQIYAWLFSKEHLEYVDKNRKYGGSVTRADGLFRAHASMEGNTIFYLHALGLADDRTETLANRLVEWQWPDGGWNCDRKPNARTSSFTESLLPLRGLAIHARLRAGSYKDAVERAAEYFLERKLFRRKRDGHLISHKFNRLHYPCFWHYDILFGLKVMKEVGLIEDERCDETLSLLSSKKLIDGGFPAEEAYYRRGGGHTAQKPLVEWGSVSKNKMNEFVTCDAISVLTSRKQLSKCV